MQKENLKKMTHFLIYSSYYILIAIIFFLILKYILPFFAPFLFGFFISFLLRPISKAISKKTKINEKLCGVVVVFLSFFLISAAFWWLGVKIVDVLKTLANSSEEIYTTYFLPIKDFFDNNIPKFFEKSFPNLKNEADNILEILSYGLNQFITSYSKHILNLLAKLGKSIPNFLVDFTFSIISAIYFSFDYEKITTFIVNIFPEKTKKFLFKTKGFTFKTIVKYFKAYFFLMLICFFLLAVSFFIIKIKNPIGIAAIVSFFDVIPIIGSGVIIIPWALALLIKQNFTLAVSLLICFFAINLLRSFLEPKILGVGLGIHPIATLISIYIGGKFLGFLGIFVAPIVTPVLFFIYKNLKKNSNLNI